MACETALFDRRLLFLRRARFAAALERHDFLLRRAADDIVARLGAVVRHFAVALDLGAHHGPLARMLARAPNIGTVISAERSSALLARCPGPRIVCDEEALPFAEASLDLVVSALSFQLVNDLPGVLIQIRRALKPDGLLLAAALGGRSLIELRQAFLAAEAELEGGASPRVAPFADVRDFGGLLQRAGFALPVTDVDTICATYASPFALMDEVRAMGAGNILHGRSRKPLRRATLLRAAEIYVERHSGADGRVAATFEIVHMSGWAPDSRQRKPLRPGSARTRLADALGVKEYPAGDKAPPPPRRASPMHRGD